MYTLDDIKKEDPEIASAITDEFERCLLYTSRCV